jgi:predicted alpha/beta superfamily hydrolase
VSRVLLLTLLIAGCGSAGEHPSDDAAPSGSDDGGTVMPPGDDGGSSEPPDLAPAITTIRIHYPAGAHAVALRGDTAPLAWDKSATLTAGPDGTTFSYALPGLTAAEVQFKPLLDDLTWSRGANYHVKNGETVDVYPHFTTMKGRVIKLIASFHSVALGNDRAVWAYLPPSYDENTTAKYPVLYMHDGQNLFDASLAFGGNEWKVDETLDAAYESDGATVKAIAELIVVAPENTAGRMYEYTPVKDPDYSDGGGGDKYLSLLIDELKPQVDSMLRTLPGRDTTGVMGSSLGGLISAYAGVKRPEVFGVVGAMSPSTWWDNDWLLGAVTATAGTAMRPNKIYVDCGTPGDDSANTQQLVGDYLGLGYVEGTTFFHVYQSGGQHNEVYWAQRLPAALAFLFPPR